MMIGVRLICAVKNAMLRLRKALHHIEPSCGTSDNKLSWLGAELHFHHEDSVSSFSIDLSALKILVASFVVRLVPLLVVLPVHSNHPLRSMQLDSFRTAYLKHHDVAKLAF
jgi:hypothetical protein